MVSTDKLKECGYEMDVHADTETPKLLKVSYRSHICMRDSWFYIMKYTGMKHIDVFCPSTFKSYETMLGSSSKEINTLTVGFGITGVNKNLT